MLKRLRDWWTRPSWEEFLAEHEENVRLKEQLEASEATLEDEEAAALESLETFKFQKAEIERLKKELEEAERDERHAFGVLDSLDAQVSETLESIGRFPPKPAGMPDRLDALCKIAKDCGEYMARLHTSQAENEQLKERLDAADHAAAGALEKLGRMLPPPKDYWERADRLVAAAKEAKKLKADAVKYANMIAAASHNIIAALESKG